MSSKKKKRSIIKRLNLIYLSLMRHSCPFFPVCVLFDSMGRQPISSSHSYTYINTASFDGKFQQNALLLHIVYYISICMVAIHLSAHQFLGSLRNHLKTNTFQLFKSKYNIHMCIIYIVYWQICTVYYTEHICIVAAKRRNQYFGVFI